MEYWILRTDVDRPKSSIAEMKNKTNLAGQLAGQLQGKLLLLLPPSQC